MGDINISVSYQVENSLKSVVEKEIREVQKTPVKVTIKANRAEFKKDIADIKSVKANVGVSRQYFKDSLKEAIGAVTQLKNAPKLQIDVDQNYLRGQVQQALKDLGQFVNGNGSGKNLVQGRLFSMDLKGDEASYNKLLSTLEKVGKLQASLEGSTNKDTSAVRGNLAATAAEINQLAEAARSGKLPLEEFNRQKSELARKVANSSGDVASILEADKQASKESAKAAKDAAKAAKEKAAAQKQDAQDAKNLEAEYIKQLNLEAQAYQKVISARKFLDQAKGAKGSSAYSDYQAQIRIIEQTSQALHNNDIGYDEARKKIAAASAEMKKLEDNMRRSGQVSNTLSDKLQRFKQHVTTISSIVNAFRMLSRVIRPVVQAVTEVDTAMTQLKIVTNESDTAMQSYAQNIMKVADQTAGSIKDLINSTTTFSRLGFSLDESTDLAKYTQMLENVGDIDEADATSAITSIVKAFDVKTDELESVMDRMVNVCKNWLPQRIVICA